MVYTTSDHHKRQESSLEDRCEELIKHNKHMMDFFKTLNKEVCIVNLNNYRLFDISVHMI